MLVSAQWGLVGVSLGLAAVVAVLTPFEMRMALGLIEMRLTTYLRSMLPHVVITAVMAGAVWLGAAGVQWLGGSASLQLLVGVVVGVGVYAGLMWRADIPAVHDARRVAGRRTGSHPPDGPADRALVTPAKTSAPS